MICTLLKIQIGCCWQPLCPSVILFPVIVFLCVFRSVFDRSADLHASLSTWYLCQQDVQSVWRMLQGMCHVSGCPALPALSQRALLAQWSVCGGLSEVTFLFSHFLTYTWTCIITTCQRCFILFSLCLCPRGFPKGGACQPCAPECTSCKGNSSYCLSCETDYLLLDHTCRSHCLPGYYATETECLHCPAHCRDCNQGGLCKSKYAGWRSEKLRNLEMWREWLKTGLVVKGNCWGSSKEEKEEQMKTGERQKAPSAHSTANGSAVMAECKM